MSSVINTKIIPNIACYKILVNKTNNTRYEVQSCLPPAEYTAPGGGSGQSILPEYRFSYRNYGISPG